MLMGGFFHSDAKVLIRHLESMIDKYAYDAKVLNDASNYP